MPSSTLPAVIAGARLHVVTGKGGVGKTTVAASLALALASTGKRVLIVEVEGRQGLSQTFDVAPLGTTEVRLVTHPGGGELWGLSVDAKAALLEYLQLFYKLGRAGSALEKIGAIDFATTIAPGVRDVLLIGKVYEAAGRPRGGRSGSGKGAGREGGLHYDAVVLDAPPTGRAVRFLNVNAGVADVAKMGPIKNQADSITRMLRDGRTLIHMVTLLEEMPVQESLDGLRDLADVGLHIGALVVNQIREPHLTPAHLAALDADHDEEDLEELLRAELTIAGLRPTNPMVRGLISEGRDHALRLALQDEMAREIVEAGHPVIELGALVGGVEDGGIAVLADELLEQGIA